MYDILIIGLGCAGYTSAIYSARYKLKTFIVGQEEGGMGNGAAEVGNWPGEIEIKGPELMEKMKKHAQSFQDLVTMKVGLVKEIEKVKGGFHLHLDGGETVEGRAVILATGSVKRHLGVKGEKEFAGKGVSYCATCDAFFFRNKTVAVIGGGDSAVEGAAILGQVAKKVYLIHRRKEFRAEPFWVDKVKSRENIELVTENGLQEIRGDKKVTSIQLNAPHGGSDTLAVDGVFVEVGSDPAVELPVRLGCTLDERGFLKVGEDQQTNIPGVFGAGDLTSNSNHFAQFTTAAGEATVAANGAFNYLQGSGK